MRYRRIEIVAYLLVLALVGLAASVAALRSLPSGPDRGADRGTAGAPAAVPPSRATTADPARGAALYRAECAACHPPGRPIAGTEPYAGPDGRGALIDLLLAGAIGGEAGAHPEVGHLDDADVAALAGHLLDLWGGEGPGITPGEVAPRRGTAG